MRALTVLTNPADPIRCAPVHANRKRSEPLLPILSQPSGSAPGPAYAFLPFRTVPSCAHLLLSPRVLSCPSTTSLAYASDSKPIQCAPAQPILAYAGDSKPAQSLPLLPLLA